MVMREPGIQERRHNMGAFLRGLGGAFLDKAKLNTAGSRTPEMARPRKRTDTMEVLRLRLAGFSWPSIASQMRLGLGTVYRAYRTAIDALQPFQNPKTAKLERVANRDCSHTVHPGSEADVTPVARSALERDTFAIRLLITTRGDGARIPGKSES